MIHSLFRKDALVVIERFKISIFYL